MGNARSHNSSIFQTVTANAKQQRISASISKVSGDVGLIQTFHPSAAATKAKAMLKIIFTIFMRNQNAGASAKPGNK
jgi:hypothetical protein